MSPTTGYDNALYKAAGVFIFAGKFTTADTAAPTTYTCPGVTISAPTAGQYTLTLAGRHMRVLCALAKIAGATGSNDDVVWIEASDAVASAGTCILETQSSAGTAANLNGPVVHFLIVCQDTSATR